MAEDGRRISGFPPGLGILLSGEGRRGAPQKARFVSCCDDMGDTSAERTLEYVFDLPYNSLQPLKVPIDIGFLNSMLRSRKPDAQQRGDCAVTAGCHRLKDVVRLDEMSICGDMRVLQGNMLVESFSVFSSARANACVWKGKWMYEVTLETCGIQQLGWTTITCPFTDNKGVGDAEDSYAFDGKRVSKWNKNARAYGQPWVVGDVIGCCIDLDASEISFYRNGIALGVAFQGVRKSGIGLGYYPAISLSQGERCYLNFGSRPFRFPVSGFSSIQSPPSPSSPAGYLLQCLTRLLDVQSCDDYGSSSFERLRKVKRFASIEHLLYPISHVICEKLFSLVDSKEGLGEYIAWGPLTSFLLQSCGKFVLHDHGAVDRALDLFLEFSTFHTLFHHVVAALSYHCRTAQLVLTECPATGSYPYLALCCHMFKRNDLMILWWKSTNFDYSLEGFLSRKASSKLDLQHLIPCVWWPGSCEDTSSESSMTLTTTTLSGAISKIEELQRELCRLVINFVPPITPAQLPGSVFRTFVQNLILKIRQSEHKLTSSGVPGNSAIVSLYMVILHFLSEGFSVDNTSVDAQECRAGSGGFLHRGGQRSFPVGLFLSSCHTDISRLGGSLSNLSKTQPVDGEKIQDVQWNEGYLEDEDTRVTHSTLQKPCCCSSSDVDFTRVVKNPIKYTAKACKGPCSPIPERSANVAAECSGRGLSDHIVDKPSSSAQSNFDLGYWSMQCLEYLSMISQPTLDVLREEELLDTMLLLYHVGVSPHFKQASYYISHQSQSISLLDETDKQIREKTCGEQLKHLKEARNVYREELADCLRQCAWYRISLYSHWKLRGMYASCMWITELLLVLSRDDTLFIYTPEFYLESLVDCFHAVRRSDPPFSSSAIFIKHGLTSFVTFIVSHFDDPRISSTDLKDLLLQSISVLVQYKDYLVAFESNKEATKKMPRALLSSFDNRSWILVTNILVRLCKGSGFGSSKSSGESSSSTIFPGLLGDACVQDGELFSCFLNRLFNTLSWTMTEFSVSIREMQENCQIAELHQKKCSVVFDLCCSLIRVLEFCTHKMPLAFLDGPDMNLRRLTELIVFILNHIISAINSDFFDMTLRRSGQNPEKTNRAMILAPLVGIILNLVDVTSNMVRGNQNDMIDILASMECPSTVHCGFRYLLGYNWGNALRGDASMARLVQLDQFLSSLLSRAEMTLGGERSGDDEVERQDGEGYCCICYASISDARFEPCCHVSCFSCITRHLLNSQRCFFCNATVVNVVKTSSQSFDSECPSQLTSSLDIAVGISDL